MAYGTASIAPVDVIAGPGNLYVAEAKRQVAGVVGVASAFAGPSEVVVVAAPETPAVLAAIDLVVQAEHGPDGSAWLVTWSEDKADEVDKEVDRIVEPRRAGRTCSRRCARAVTSAWSTTRPGRSPWPTPWRPSTSSCCGRGPRRYCPSCGPPGRSSSDPGRRPAWGTTWPARTTCCRPTAAPASPPPCAPTTSFATSTPCGPIARLSPGRLGPPRRHPGRGRGAARARRVDPAAIVGPLPALRPGLQLGAGYHSPQVPAEVRLNTNESPFRPPGSLRRRAVAAELSRVEFHRYPDRSAGELRRGLAELHGVTTDRDLLRQRIQRGAPVPPAGLRRSGTAGAAVRADLYAARPHRPADRHRGDGRARERTSRIDPAAALALMEGGEPAVTFVCSPNNPTGMCERPEVVRALLHGQPGLLVVDEAYGQFASWSALELPTNPPAVARWATPAPWRWSGRSPRPGRWRRSGSGT